jgi:hypothetical protein
VMLIDVEGENPGSAHPAIIDRSLNRAAGS